MEEKKIPDFVDKNLYPDFWEQVNNFQEFAKSVGQGVIQGNGIFSTEEKRKKREEICNNCSQFNRDSKRCYLCGCYMEVKWKFKKSECPMNMW